MSRDILSSVFQFLANSYNSSNSDESHDNKNITSETERMALLNISLAINEREKFAVDRRTGR
jgi:hypothetical protein